MGHLADRYRDASRSGVYRVTDAAVPRAAALEAGSGTQVLILEGLDSLATEDFKVIAAIAEHLQCGYLPLLELACLAELQPHLPARYRETCAKLERDARGRIVMPPPDIAPSCS